MQHNLAEESKVGLDWQVMKTSKLVAAAFVLAVVPPLMFYGCNKQDDAVPAPSATVAPPPPPSPPPAVPTVAATTQAVTAPQPAPVAVVKAAVRADGGVHTDAGVLAFKLDAAAMPTLPTGFPSLPNIQPSTLPGIASGIVGGIIGALPSGVLPVPTR